MTKTALITGASRGLGAALALELAPTHHIIAVAKTSGALEELDDQVKARGGTATLAPMDITNDAAMATLCRGIYDRWGSLNLWMHAAVHAAPLAPASMIDAKDMSKSVAANITATATLITYIAPLLGSKGVALAAPFFVSDFLLALSIRPRFTRGIHRQSRGHQAIEIPIQHPFGV